MVIGNYCDTFAQATHAMPQGMSLNAPYKFHWLKVVRVEGQTLHCTGAGQPMQFKIVRNRTLKCESVELTINDPIFGPRKFLTLPFKGTER